MHRLKTIFGYTLIPSALWLLSIWSTSCTYRDRQTLLAGTCDTTMVTYSGTVSGIMTSYCTNCHGGSAPSAGISLEGYNNVKAMVISGQLWGTMNHESGFKPMPQGTPKLDACTLNKLLAWIHQGAQNN